MSNQDPPDDLDADLIVVLSGPHPPTSPPRPERPSGSMPYPPASPYAPSMPYAPVPAPSPSADPPLAGTADPAPPEDVAPEWWTAMSRTDDEGEPERVGRVPRHDGPTPDSGGTAEAAHRRTVGMLALASLLGVLVFAGVLTHFMS